jgi:hypothetical protein
MQANISKFSKPLQGLDFLSKKGTDAESYIDVNTRRQELPKLCGMSHNYPVITASTGHHG